jgi:UDP-N-acetylglucosamine 1-carboxyvinyltransferase
LLLQRARSSGSRPAGIEHLRSTRLGFARLGIECVEDGDDLIVPAKQRRKIQADLGDHVP